MRDKSSFIRTSTHLHIRTSMQQAVNCGKAYAQLVTYFALAVAGG
jgi:hypothetical protein